MDSYSITPARYAKGKLVVKCPSPDGFKTRAACLVAAMGKSVRYVGRSGGYVVSPVQAARFERLYMEGWNATYFGRLIPPPPSEDSPHAP